MQDIVVKKENEQKSGMEYQTPANIGYLYRLYKCNWKRQLSAGEKILHNAIGWN